MERPPLVNALHHWWPKAVSKYWANADGLVNRLSHDGAVLSAPPKQFGAIRSDNNIRLGATPTVWDETFEPSFNQADSAFGGLVDWLLSLSSPVPAHEASRKRVIPLIITRQQQLDLAECLASLIVRGPALRSRVGQTVEYYRGRMGLKDVTADAKLIGANIRNGQRVLANAMARGGKYAILRAASGEFIFGDGFYHNISSVTDAPLGPRAIIPLTPEIAVFYTRPSSYATNPIVSLMNVRPDEVAFFNYCVQVYSAKYIFYGSIPPIIDPTFEHGTHGQFEYHRHPSIEALEQLVAQTYFDPKEFVTAPSAMARGGPLR